MKNQYFGDINDYRKYGILRALQDGSDLPLAVCWMLTPDDGGADGRKVAYLHDPDRWRGFDPEVFDRLRTALLEDQRSIVVAEQTFLRSAKSYPRILGHRREDRATYFADLIARLDEPGLVFFDPDNGIEVKSTPMGRKGAEKYLFWEELAGIYHAGHSCLIYQHFPRVEREEFVGGLVHQARDHFDPPWVATIRTSHVLFVLVPQADHVQELRAGLQRLEEVWQGEVRTRIHDDVAPRPKLAAPASIAVIIHYAFLWFRDAVAEAVDGRTAIGTDRHQNVRREIVFSVFTVESYLTEFVRDNHWDLAELIPAGDRRPISDRWKDVPKQLLARGLINGTPDHAGQDWEEFLHLIDLRDGLVHGRSGRFDSIAPRRPEITSFPTQSDLDAVPSGWPSSVVAFQIRKLNEGAGTASPRWLGEWGVSAPEVLDTRR